MNEQQIPAQDIVPICRQILQQMLAGAEPEAVQAELAMQGISAADAENLINVSVASAQSVSPILEEGGEIEQAVETLTSQGMDESLALPMVQMISSFMDGAEGEVDSEAAQPSAAPQSETVDEERMKAVIRLAIAVDSDLAQGVDRESIHAAIINISDIDQYPEVAGDVMEFISNVALARNTCNRSLKNNDLQKTMTEMGLSRKPAYVAMIAAFFTNAVQG